MAPEKSLEAVVWCAVGGRGTLIGPILGAVGVNALKSWATRAFPDQWLIILGGLFIRDRLFMPRASSASPHRSRSCAIDSADADLVPVVPERLTPPAAEHQMSRQRISSSPAEGVNKTFDGFKAINDLNFYMDEGELRTVIGPNGAGKSTLLDLITGRTKPDTGKIEFEGTPT